VDIWSTGVVLYTMLVGRPPYESKDVKATYKRILANDFTFPEQVKPITTNQNVDPLLFSVVYSFFILYELYATIVQNEINVTSSVPSGAN